LFKEVSMKAKGLVVFVLVLFVAAGIAYAKDYEVKKKAGEYDVEVKIDRNPPVVGDNNVKVEIKDSAGKRVTDAKVVVDYGMPAMPGMPAMNYKTDAELKGDEYKAKMNLSMSGSWNIAVKITRAGKTSTMKFTVDAK
jgi:inner membrane protein involved in colicin E2 resistance